MTECCDALSLAVAVVNDLFAEDDCAPGWGDVAVSRLLSGGGWLVTFTRHTIVLDRSAWKKELAA